MILSSKPKPVNFRIVLNNTEITSLESLQENFDLERLIVNDRTQLISWLKRVDRIKSDKIEAILRESKDEITYQSITKILSVIYGRDFADMVEFVNYLYKNGNEKSKRNFAHFMLKHEELLHEWFPIDSTPQENSGLDELFTLIRQEGTSPDTKWYFSQLYYRAGDIQQSIEINPSSWNLGLDERIAIKAICSGTKPEKVIDAFYSNQLSIIGVEFLFMCALGYLILNQKDNHIETISKSIDKKHEFSSLRNRIGGSLVKILDKQKGQDYEQLIDQLGYLTPNPNDPLYNEKLFLSSFIVKNKREAIIQEICKKNDYFPAHFMLGEDGYKSETLIQPDELIYQRWLKHILDYYLSPQGIDGDVVRDIVREEVIIAHLFKTYPSLMKKHFCDPNHLSTATERNESLQKRIQRLQGRLTKQVLSNPPKLTETEDKYVDFCKKIYSIIMNFSNYFTVQNFLFTQAGTDLIYDFSESNDLFKQEKRYIVILFYIIRNRNVHNVSYYEQKLKENYVPLKSLFLDMEKKLSDNDKRILDYHNFSDDKCLCLNSYWSLVSDYNGQHRFCLIHSYLVRWFANFIYYINPNSDEQ